MDAKRLTGVNAGSLKYDVLTAISSLGLQSEPRLQMAAARMVLLITARYNWRLDEVSVGQRDLARMWNVTERTVKREMKFWLEQRLVICRRRGVRGRVAAYRLNYPEIYSKTEPFWPTIGPDFVERMQASNPVQMSKVVQVDFATPAQATPISQIDPNPAEVQGPGAWRDVCRRLRGLHPAQFQSWIAPLQLVADTQGTVRLEAPTRFAAQYIQTHLMGILGEAVEAELGPRNRIVITAAQEPGPGNAG